jgi:hypothetical protein
MKMLGFLCFNLNSTIFRWILMFLFKCAVMNQAAGIIGAVVLSIGKICENFR